MRQLPVPARFYLMSCYLAGSLALGWCLRVESSAIMLRDWVLAASLAAVAALCQVFAVARHSTTGQRSDHLTLAPLFAAVVLLPPPLLAGVIITTFLPEWRVYRRSWFGQLFNIAAFLCAAVLSRLVFDAVVGSAPSVVQSPVTVGHALAFVTAIPVFEATQAFLLALVLRLARGQSFRQSGLFTSESLLLELGLIGVGLGFAVAYLASPILAPVTALPIVLIFNALHVPNLKDEAATDPKTGLANMRQFNKVMSQALHYADQHGTPVSLLVCDLDYLRNINNTYGHQAGDTVLVGIAHLLRQHVRPTDLVGRFGGEEFVVVLPETPAPDAVALAEALRRAIETTAFSMKHGDDPITATMSIGVATFPYDGRTYEALLHEADLAVYQAKRDGRNRVVQAGWASRQLAVAWAKDNLVPPEPPSVPAESSDTNRFLQLVERATGSVTGVRSAQRAAPAAIASVMVTAGQPPAKSVTAPRVLLFVATVLVAGLASLLAGWSIAHPGWIPICVLFGCLTAIAEQMSITSNGRNRISVSTVPILAAAYLCGEVGVLVTAGVAAISIAVKTRSATSRFCFNLGTIILSAHGAEVVFRSVTHRGLDDGAFTPMLIPAILAGLTYHAINQVLLCTVRGMQERRQPLSIWRDDYRWLWPHYPVLGVLALVVAHGYADHGIAAVLALTAPVAMMDVALRQYVTRTKVFVDELQHLNGRLTDSYEATLHALSRALDTRDEETEEHSQRVRAYTALLAERLGVSDTMRYEIERGALLHDIGKIGVPDAILLKAGRLTPEEATNMRRHPEIGYSMIAHIPFLAEAAKIVLYHHEAYDGSGYPSGLCGEQIPLGARIFAVADAFDAITSDRPYRAGRPAAVALAEIAQHRGTQFDPAVVDALLAVPVAELLALRDQRRQTPAIVPLDRAGDPVLAGALATAR